MLTKHSLSKIVCLFIAMLALFGKPFSYGQDAIHPVTIAIKAPQERVVSGENVRIDVTITNNSQELISLYSSRSRPAEAGIVVLDALNKPLTPRADAPTAEGHGNHFGIVIPSGKSVKETIYLNRWFDLIEPGKYFIHIKRKVPEDPSAVESNTLTITILAKSS